MATVRGAAKMPPQPFVRSLLLPRAFARQFGRNDEALSRLLADTRSERDAAGVSGCARTLLALPGLAVAPEALLRWDAAIGAHEAAIREARAAYVAAHGDLGDAAFRLTHFQWLACAVVEWHLEALGRDAPAHVARIEALRERELPHLGPYTAADARKLACFMATGAGKTLMLHMNLRQFMAHGLFAPANVLLLTPGEALSAQHAAELEASGLAGMGVRVTEITKFYVDGRGRRRPRKGVSVATSRYEGPNLLLVDEGHKGTGGSGDDSEQGWRLKREALAAGATEQQAGFTFEYSATFAQIADRDADLYQEYARCIAIDFGYARFWREGYGKQPRQLNARHDSGADFALAAGLVAFYQQRRAFDAHPALAAEYRVAPPLLACVGKEVTAGAADSDVARLVAFLARACGDAPWLAAQIEAVFAHAEPAQSTIDLPPLDLRWLREAMAAGGESVADVAADLARRVFGGAGALELRLVSDKEIGLRSRGAASDAYFGLVRVGEARKLAEQLHRHGIAVLGEPDRLAGSLFARLDSDPRLAVLIGAKMFIEGWSSWRVSALGLMHVGLGAGAEIVQLFGRGVRLRGKGFSLKRDDAAALPVQVLQSLQVFGVRADYMQTYLETLAREGVQAQVFHVPVTQQPALDELGLRTLAHDVARFDEPVVFDAAAVAPQRLRIEPAVRATVGLGPAQALGAPMELRRMAADWLDSELAYQHALALKGQRGWVGLIATCGALAAYLSRCEIEAPMGYFDNAASATARKAQAALSALEGGIASAWRQAERRWRMERLAVEPLTLDNAGLPSIETAAGRTLAWRLEVNVARSAIDPLLAAARMLVEQGLRPAAFVDELTAFLVAQPGGLLDIGRQLQELLAAPDVLAQESMLLPLPRLHCTPHLFAPVLLDQALRPGAAPGPTGETLPLFGDDAFIDVPVRISPPPLNRGEAAFLWNLRAYWQTAHASAEWLDIHLFVLRNPAADGLTLYRDSGFAPDFMLWLRRGESQALGLVDPKGLVRQWPADKLALIGELQAQPLSLPVRGFLVTASPLQDIALPPGVGADSASLRSQRVLLQADADHIEYLLRDLRDALAPSSVLTEPPCAPIS